jgi:hypothetical protein
MTWFIKIMCTFRIPALFPLPVVMEEEAMEEGVAEVTSIVRVETTVRRDTTPPRLAVRREVPDKVIDPARRRILRAMRILVSQTAVRARWALQPPRFLREEVTDPARQRIVQPM